MVGRIGNIPGRSHSETISLTDLSDVTIISPADNEFLVYDSATSEWINQTPTEAGLDNLYLKLNQTTPQTVINGIPIFDLGLTSNTTITSNKINLGGGLTAFILNGVSLDAVVGATSQLATELQYVAIQHSNVALAGSRFMLSRSRGTLATPLVVQNNDVVAAIDAAAFDGTDYVLAAQIDFEIDGVPGGNDMPGRIIFKTTAGGGVLPTERMRISSTGLVTIAGDLTISGDDLFMATNTANYFLMADGTNYNPTSPADARTGLGLISGGAGDIWVEKAGDTMTGQLFIDGGANEIQLIIQANSTQALDLKQNQDLSGNVLSGIDERGIPFADGNTDASNYFAGDNAGNVADGGTNNVGIGLNAMDLVTGANNTGVGKSTLTDLTSGNQNVAVGASAGSNISTGSSNFAMGFQSLLNITTQNNNVGAGSNAGKNAVGIQNTFIGSLAGGGAGSVGSTNNNNVAIGYSALDELQAASKENTIIGTFAGASAPLSGNIFIGFRAGFRQTGSDTLIIDNEQRADIATEQTNAILYGAMASTPSNQTLRINAATTIPDSLFIDGSSDEIQLIIQANGTQTADLTEWQSSAGVEVARVDASGNSVFPTVSAINLGGDAKFEGISNDFAYFSLIGYSNTKPPFFLGRRARGTVAAPTAVLNGDFLFDLNFDGHYGAGFTTTAAMRAVAAENHSATNKGTSLDFLTTAIGASSPNLSFSIIGTHVTTYGGRIVSVTTVNAATYDLLTTDHILNVTYTSTGAVTSLTLPTAQVVGGRIITIKDAGGNAATNNITIDTQGAETIDGSATYVMSSDYDSITIYCDGSNWYVI